MINPTDKQQAVSTFSAYIQRCIEKNAHIIEARDPQAVTIDVTFIQEEAEVMADEYERWVLAVDYGHEQQEEGFPQSRWEAFGELD